MADYPQFLPLPTIHLNGSGRAHLIQGYLNSHRTALAARAALADVE